MTVEREKEGRKEGCYHFRIIDLSLSGDEIILAVGWLVRKEEEKRRVGKEERGRKARMRGSEKGSCSA